MDNEKVESIAVYKKEDIEEAQNKIEIIKKNNFESIYTYLPQISSVINAIKTEVYEDNLKGILELRANLNKLSNHISKVKKEWFDKKTFQLNKYIEDFKEFETLIEFKTQAISSSEKKFKEKDEILRVKKFEEFFNENKEAYDLFDFINFEEHFYDDSMKNKGNFKKDFELKKAAKEYILDKFKKFDDDKLALGNDPVAIDYYKNNGFNCAETIAFLQKQKELEEKRQQIIKSKQKESENEDIEKVVEEKASEFQKVTISEVEKKIEREDIYDVFNVKVPKKISASFEDNLKKFNLFYTKK